MKNSSSLSTVFISLLLFLSFSSLLSAQKQKCNPHDKKVLLEIKADLGNPDYLSSWNPKVDCCVWYHTGCNLNHVTVLSIFAANLNHVTVPSAIGDLQSLEIVSFFSANLTGTIPSSIANLSNLTQLTLAYNNLSGPIPTFLTKLKNLDHLDLSGNSFTGSIPPELSQLPNLGVLYLNLNKLTGTIPESFGHFVGNIQQINLADNYLTGTVRKSFGNLNLTLIILAGNKLTGDASVLFGKNRTQLDNMDISRNNFAFDFSRVEFPDSLTILDISHNKIFGSIPRQLTQSNIQYLNVSYNRLCGEIPKGGKLEFFDISSCSHNKCLCGSPLPACK